MNSLLSLSLIVIDLLQQGESIPAIKLAQTASHLEEVKRFVKKVNMTLHGRNEDDLEISSLKNQFQKLVSLNSPPQLPAKPTPFVPPPPVQTAYQPTKPTELELNEREKFWQEVGTIFLTCYCLVETRRRRTKEGRLG